jgi:hypothetical protein
MPAKPLGRVSDLEEMVGDIPGIINIRFAHIRAQLEALDARLGTVELKIDRLNNEVQGLRREIPDLIATAVGAAMRKG